MLVWLAGWPQMLRDRLKQNQIHFYKILFTLGLPQLERKTLFAIYCTISSTWIKFKWLGKICQVRCFNSHLFHVCKMVTIRRVGNLLILKALKYCKLFKAWNTFKFQNVPNLSTLWMFDRMGVCAEFAQLICANQCDEFDNLIFSPFRHFKRLMPSILDAYVLFQTWSVEMEYSSWNHFLPRVDLSHAALNSNEQRQLHNPPKLFRRLHHLCNCSHCSEVTSFQAAPLT